MNINYFISGNTLNVSLIGELDECSASNTRELIDKVIDKSVGVTRLIFNLNELSFMDSTGIGMMIGRYKKAKSYGIKVFIEKPNNTIIKILELSGLYQIMPLI